MTVRLEAGVEGGTRGEPQVPVHPVCLTFVSPGGVWDCVCVCVCVNIVYQALALLATTALSVCLSVCLSVSYRPDITAVVDWV